MRVRDVAADDRLAARSIFDAAMLEVPDLDRATLLVAVAGGGEESERVVGALAVHSGASAAVDAGDTPREREDSEAPGEISAVAVRPGRRGQGVGTALVETAAARWTPLVATFDERVRPFYDALGFEVEERAGGRLRGIRR